MRKTRIFGSTTLAVALLTLGFQYASAGASPATFFGADLDTHSQPSNAEGGQTCDKNHGIPHGSLCTWVSIEAYHNGGHEQAPITGTIHHVNLVSCVAGSFTIQLAHAKPSKHKAQVVRDGPLINYAGQAKCRNKFLVQSFPVDLHVDAGDYIAITTDKTGALYCAGGSGLLLYAPPLSPGGPLTKTKSSASCNLLVQLSYT
jgi:hypothetical protein